MLIIYESRDADGAQMRDVSVDRVRFALRRLTAFAKWNPKPTKSAACPKARCNG